MGIRFRCHYCEHELHVKDFLAGKRGRCPNCDGKFRIPTEDAGYSLPFDSATSLQPPSKEKPSGNAVSDSPADGLQVAESQGSDSPQASVRSKGNMTNDASSNVSFKENNAHPTTTDNYAQSAMPAIVGRELPTRSRREEETDQGLRVSPAAVSSAADSVWYVRIADGSQFGPAAPDVFMQWLVEKRVQRDSLVWRDGWEQWKLASEAFADYFTQPATSQGDSPGQSTEPVAVANMAGKLAQPASETIAKPAQGFPSAGAPTSSAGRVPSLPVSRGDQSRLERKRRRKRNYSLTITFLSVAAVLLIIALVIVLVVQQK